MKACGKNMEDRGKLVGDREEGEKSIVSLKKKIRPKLFFLIENLISLSQTILSGNIFIMKILNL